MKRKQKNKGLKITLIIVLALCLIAGIFCAIYFLSKDKGMKYYQIELVDNRAELPLTTNSKRLAPNMEIINRPVSISLTENSSKSYMRAKIIFESNSNDNRVLSFVSQLNYNIKDIATYKNDAYSWRYYELDNSFYLMSKESENLKTVTSKDNSYIFVDKLIVPKNLEQMDSLNSNGDNVQIGEDITLRIVFEAIQCELLSNNNPKIDNTRSFFNNFCYNQENNFTSLNGYITGYTGQDTNLILPKYVGKDYIIGVAENAFNIETLKSIIIPGNYFKFFDNAFINSENLTFVSLKNQANVSLQPNTFSAKSSLEIYATPRTISLVEENYSTYNYMVNFKNFTEITNANVQELEKNITYLYAPNLTEFVGDFKEFTNLKAIYAPYLSKINDEMFANLTNLIDVDCPNILNVGKSAFYACTNLLNVNFSKNIDAIGESSFAGCSRLKDVSFIKNLKIVPKEAFKNCNAMVSLELNADNLEVLNGGFYNCKSLRVVKINQLSKLDSYAFGECDSLYYFNVKSVSNLTVENSAFSSSISGGTTSRMIISSNQESVKTAFTNINPNFNFVVFSVNTNKVLTKYTGNIKNLDLTEFAKFYNFNKIGDSAFKGDKNLVTITIPNLITEIGSNFVDDIETLTTITINSYLPPKFNENCFDSIVENLNIYVPSLNLEVYKATLKGYNVKVIGI